MTDHYYSEKQNTPFKPEKIKVKVLGGEIEFYTSGGVFSPKKLDNGSRLLIENVELTGEGFKDTESVLDLGCGYGVVGLVLKILNPTLEVTCVDVNERAIKLIGMNSRLNKVKVESFKSDKFDSKRFIDKKFDLILLNPPQSAGKDVCVEMIRLSIKYLNIGGRLEIVVRHQKGGKVLSGIMQEVYGNMEVVSKGSGFRVYRSVKE